MPNVMSLGFFCAVGVSSGWRDSALATATDSLACDDFATRPSSPNSIKSQIEALECGALGRRTRQKGHQLKSVCYSSTGSQSRVEIVADLEMPTPATHAPSSMTRGWTP